MSETIRKDQSQEPMGHMIRLRKGEAKPENARLLTHGEVIQMQQKIVMNWQPRSEMWPFSWGIGALGGASAVSGIFINNFCRRRLGLMNLGRLATYAPTVVLPVALSTVFHTIMVSNKILIGDFPCTVCAAVRSGSIQSLAGAVYPMVLGPLVCIVLARKYHTYHVPTIQETTQFLPFIRRILPGPGYLLAIALMNFALGMVVTERQTMLFAKYLSPTSSSLSRPEDGEEMFD